jgi:hypothetical protein
MNIETVQRQFADCDLPITFLDADPRRFIRPRGFFADYFYVDVLSRRRDGDCFRVFADTGEIQLRVIDARPATRHLLLLATGKPASERKEVSRRLLMGHDERQLFIVNSDRAKSVEDAIEALKPFAVRAALRRNLKVIRQGDWFFIPRYLQPLFFDANVILHRNLQLGGPNASRWNIRTAHPHIADEQALSFGDVVDRTSSTGRVIPHQLRAIFVRGKIRHAEHATVHLREWHQAVPNTATAADDFRSAAPRDVSLGFWD